MLLVKCDCGASYKLSEELFKRKAAGFGVVVTCRRCKKEIHVDEGASTGPSEEGTVNELPTAPVNERPEPEKATAKTPTTPNALPPTTAKASPPVVKAPPSPAKATLLGGTQAPSPPGLKVMPKPPTPGGPPRPGGGPRVVALSPGLLGTVTAVKESPKAPPVTAVKESPKAPPVGEAAKPPPVAPKAATAEAQAGLPSSERDTIPPPDSAAPTPRPASSAADSEIPIESQDFLGESAPAASPGADAGELTTAPLPAVPAKEEPKKRLPTAPAVKRPGAAAAAKPDEQPSTTGTPKLDALVHGPAAALDKKKGDAARKRLPSGDLSDDFMSADLGFDAPPLAPPDAMALLKAPVSSRPAAADKPVVTAPSDAKNIAPKSPQPVIIKKETASGSGRGKFAVGALLLLGAGALMFRDRLTGKQHQAEPEPAAAAVAKAPEPPAAEPAAPATPEVAAPAAAAPASANTDSMAEPLPEPEPKPNPADTAAAPATPAAAAPAAAAPAPAAATPGAPVRPAATTAAASTTPAQPAATTTPTAPATPREPRTVGSDPFDAAAARAALDASAGQASTCRKEGDPSGVAVVIITFAPTGRVTTANISGPPFAATPTGGCIASTLRKTRVPPFAGDLVTVKKTVTIH